MDELIPCGVDGYAWGFAYKYCLMYLSKREEFINKEWQDGVRSCLQRDMLSKLRQHSGGSCDDIKDWGFSSHTGCYLRPIPDRPDIDFCKLPWPDKEKIAWAAKGTLIHLSVWLEIVGVANECAGQIVENVDAAAHIQKLMREIEEYIKGIVKESIEFTIEGVKRWLLDKFNGDCTIINPCE